MEQKTTSQSGFADSCSSPLLVFVHGKSKKKSQTFYSLLKKRLYVKSIRELRNDFSCWPIAQGGVMLLDPVSNKRFIFDLATMKNVELPQLDLSGRCDFVLSSPVSDRNCVVLCTEFRRKHLYFCRPGGDKWVKYEYDLGEDNIMSAVVACQGKFYGRTRLRKFVNIEFDPHPALKILAETYDHELPVGLNWHMTYLLESCKKIFYVKAFVFATTMKLVHISVYSFNFSKKEWESVESIGGDRVFFLDAANFSASWSASKLGVKGNCIYFVKHEDKCLYIFDMEEGTIATHLPCPNVPSPWSTPFWIMPTP